MEVRIRSHAFSQFYWLSIIFFAISTPCQDFWTFKKLKLLEVPINLVVGDVEIIDLGGRS